MKFNKEFRNRVEYHLQVNKVYFKEACLDLIQASLKSYFRTIVDNVSGSYSPFFLDLESSIQYIKKNLDQENTPALQLRKLRYKNNRYNEIFFSFFEKEELIYNSPEEIQYKIERKELEIKCEHEFWQVNENVIEYQQLSQFECFTDISISEADLSKYQGSSRYLYNIEGWLSYIHILVKKNFPEFIFNEKHSTTKILRFLKSIGNNCFFGFEYNISDLTKEIKKGDICLPYYFNLIIINQEFKKSSKYEDYLFAYNDNVLSLGTLDNPFVFEPCFPLLGYQAVEMHYDRKNPSAFVYNYRRQFNQNSDGTFKITHPKEFGEKLKKHAFFYMKALRYSSMGYVNYVEKSILDTVGGKKIYKM